jgi:hypothetical protein
LWDSVRAARANQDNAVVRLTVRVRVRGRGRGRGREARR